MRISSSLKESSPPPKPRLRRRSPAILILLVLVWSLILGWGFSQALNAAQPSQPPGTVDIVPPSQQLGQQLYLENCATCHIGIPPATLPTQTWRDLLRDSQHYGVNLQPLVDPQRLLVWNYLRAFSRQEIEGERLPYRLGESKYFRILHPKVKLPRPLSLSSCATCHPGASQYNFRSLTPEWENSP